MSHSGYTNSQKNIAHQAVKNAIKRGELARASSLSCSNCGGNAIEYHHYMGYSRQYHLTVKPLCKPCHSKEHKRDGENLGKLKLSDDDVRAARKMRHEGAQVKHIADFFGIGYTLMGNVLNGKSYKWVK